MIIFFFLLFAAPLCMAMERSSNGEQMRQLLLQRQAILKTLIEQPSTNPDAPIDYLLLLRETNRDLRIIDNGGQDTESEPSRPLRHRIHLRATERSYLLAQIAQAKRAQSPPPPDQTSCCCFGLLFKKN